jgi:hypothetical protein
MTGTSRPNNSYDQNHRITSPEKAKWAPEHPAGRQMNVSAKISINYGNVKNYQVPSKKRTKRERTDNRR